MIEKRRSKIQGWGVYAAQAISKNTRIIDYAGELISHRESLRRELRTLPHGRVWCFTVNRRYVRDAAAALREVERLGPARLAEFDWRLAPKVRIE